MIAQLASNTKAQLRPNGRPTRNCFASFVYWVSSRMASLLVEGNSQRDEDWIEKFIDVVQSKPAIYDTTLKEHCNRSYVSRQWDDVCATMVPTWYEMAAHVRTLKAKELQQRWRNLRTCFRRELNKQRNTKPGQSVKRRKYIYFDKLLFLLPIVDDKDNISESSQVQTEEENSENEFYLTEDPLAEQTSHYTLPPLDPKTSSAFDGPFRKLVKEEEDDDVDEDKLFLLSLVPSFRKMTMNEKIDAKIEFLSVIQRILQNHPLK